MKTRLIVAAVLLPLLILLLFVAPKICTTIICGLAAALAAYELTKGTGLVKHIRLCLYSMISACWVCIWCGLNIGYAWLLLGILVFWAALFAEVMFSQLKIQFNQVAICLAGGIVLPLLLGSVVRIHSSEFGRAFVAAPFVLAFMSDSGAYFAGHYFGKHKLAPTISPKKTIEGVVGGVLGAMLGMMIYCGVLQLFCGFTCNFLFALIYGLLGSLAAVFGDLCFSAVKRQTGIKDYGNLIPGHGGILDRLDSMMVVGPLTEILLLLLPLAVKL